MYRLNTLTRSINRMAGSGNSTLPPLIVDPAAIERRTVSPAVMRAIYGKVRSVRKGTQSKFLRKRGSYGYHVGLPAATVHRWANDKAEQFMRNERLSNLLKPFLNQGAIPA